MSDVRCPSSESIFISAPPPGPDEVTGTLASLLEAEAYRHPWTWAPLMMQLRQSIRMSVDKEVMARSEEIKWKNNSDAGLSKEILGSLKLPYNPCWLEWNPREINPDDHDRAGVLVCMEDGALRVGLAVAGYGNKAFWNAAFAYASPTAALGVKWMWGRNDQPDPALWEQAAMKALGTACRLLSLITARNAPVSVGEPIEFGALNERRAISGEPPLLSHRPVRWNLNRFERKAGRVFSEGERADAKAHLCRGHIKIRKSGAYWWSPHWRGLHGGPAPDAGRDHQVSAGPT